jgi:hypothetical protein
MTAIPEATQRRLDDLSAEIDRLTASAEALQAKAAETLAQVGILKAQRCTTQLTLREAGLDEATAEELESAPEPSTPSTKRHPVARLAKQTLDTQGHTTVAELVERFGVPWASAQSWAKRALSSNEITIGDNGVIRYAASEEEMGTAHDE